MSSILKRKLFKRFSFPLLTLSLQSFICLQAVRCKFLHFFFFFFFLFCFPADSAAGMKAASGSGVAQCFRWPLCFFFVSCSFEAYLHHSWKSSARVCDAHEHERTQNGQKLRKGLRYGFSSVCESHKQNHKLPVRTYQDAAPRHLRRWWCAQAGHRFRPLPQSPGR